MDVPICLFFAAFQNFLKIKSAKTVLRSRFLHSAEGKLIKS